MENDTDALTPEKRLKLYEDMMNQGADLCDTDKGDGELINKILWYVKEYATTDMFNNLNKQIAQLDPNLCTKNNFIQKVIINRLLIDHLLNIMVNYEENTNDYLLLCCNAYTDDVWLKGVLDKVIPFLIKYKKI